MPPLACGTRSACPPRRALSDETDDVADAVAGDVADAVTGDVAGDVTGDV